MKNSITSLLLIFVISCCHSLMADDCSQFITVGSPVQLTFDLADDVEPSWSPDGTMIAFASDRTGNQEIYIIDLSSGMEIQVTSNGNRNWHPDWSPDAQLISYTGGPYSDQIWVSTPDGSIESVITSSGPHRHPDWSPDGSEFAYTAAIGVEGPIRIINSDGIGAPATVINSGWYADWSPDGNRIAFARYSGAGQIYLVDVDGSNLKNISTSGDYHAYPAWSPDGSVIACSITKNGNSEICIIDTLGNELLQVTDSPSSDDIYPTWSPMGDAVAFYSNRSGNADIWRVGVACNGGSYIPVPFDIKPGSCPNALNLNLPYAEVTGEMEDIVGLSSAKVVPGGVLNRKPVIPAAILGTDEFDVYNINIATILLEGVVPDRWSYEDVATPVDEIAAECECNDYGPDGYLDLALKFDKADIVEIIGEVVPGQVVPLTITGELNDGTPFEGVDCVVIVGNTSEEPGYDGDYVALVGTGLPTEFALFQNRPNPFNPITDLSFNLPNPCNVILTVYDILGRKIETLADRHFEAGNHTIEWDGSRYSSGIYFYRLEAGDFVETRKMTLLK